MTLSPFIQRYRSLGHTVVFKEPVPTIRVNTLLTTIDELKKRLEGVQLTKIPFLKNGYVASTKHSLASTTPYLLGHYYIQETAAQIPAEVLGPQQGESVLDLCSAPGGKTTQLSQLMNNTGTIHSYESQHHRIPSLLNNLERMNCTNVIVHEENALSAVGSYDKVLLDAPCSGNLAADEHWFEKRTIGGVRENSAR